MIPNNSLQLAQTHMYTVQDYANHLGFTVLLVPLQALRANYVSVYANRSSD